MQDFLDTVEQIVNPGLREEYLMETGAASELFRIETLPPCRLHYKVSQHCNICNMQKLSEQWGRRNYGAFQQTKVNNIQSVKPVDCCNGKRRPTIGPPVSSPPTTAPPSRATPIHLTSSLPPGDTPVKMVSALPPQATPIRLLSAPPFQCIYGHTRIVLRWIKDEPIHSTTNSSSRCTSLLIV